MREICKKEAVLYNFTIFDKKIPLDRDKGLGERERERDGW